MAKPISGVMMCLALATLLVGCGVKGDPITPVASHQN